MKRYPAPRKTKVDWKGVVVVGSAYILGFVSAVALIWGIK